MSEVYFSKELDKILEKIDFTKLGKNVAIKLHFGEMGCETYLSSQQVKKIYEKIVSLGKKATLVECNVLYRGSRTNKKDHIKTALAHGFDFAPIDILDGEVGEDEMDVTLSDASIKIAKLGAGIKKYDSMIALTHFKGHIDAGYGGAFKNIGMGLGSRAGKLMMHAGTKPFINRDKCIGCKLCIENCNFNAIILTNGKAQINTQKCAGCAMCIAVCPHEAASIPWGSSSHEEVCKKIVDHAQAVLTIIPNTVFINFLQSITKDCDCFGIKQEPLMQDVGILYSKDIVAIDAASLDLANKYSEGKFEKLNNIRKNMQIEYAYSKKMGDKNYKLLELS